MSGKVIISSFLVLAVWSAISSAEVAPILACLDNELSVNLDGKRVDYYGVETYFRYDTDNILVRKHPDHYYKFTLDGAFVIFRGDAKVDHAKYSVKKSTIIKVNTRGVASTLSQTKDSNTLSHCSVTVTKNAADSSNLPENLISEVLNEASKCLTLQLCPSFGTISNDKIVN